MAWVDAVTGGAALLAAVFAGLNLYISGRRELDKWTRETLIDTISLFLDASFKHAGACRSIFRSSPQGQELDRLRAEILLAHDRETDSLTRLRILAPPPVVEAARKLLESEYSLAEPCFGGDISRDISDTLIRPVQRDRTHFIEAARAALGLREAAGTGSFEKFASYGNLRSKMNRAIKKDDEPKNAG
jgi:hypothetical protein